MDNIVPIVIVTGDCHWLDAVNNVSEVKTTVYS